jgi:hypothetical protein
VALPTHALQLAQVWSKSVSNEGHFNLMPKEFFVPISTTTVLRRRIRHTSYVLQLAQVCSKWVSNEGHFTLDAQRVFCSYIDYHCIAATHTSYVALPAHVLQLAHVWSKSDSKEGHFTLVAKQFLVPVSTIDGLRRCIRHTWHSQHTHYN